MAPLNALHRKTPPQSSSGGSQVLSPPLPNTHQVQNLWKRSTFVATRCTWQTRCTICTRWVLDVGFVNIIAYQRDLERTNRIQCGDLDKNQYWKKATSKSSKNFLAFKFEFEWKLRSLTCKEGMIEFLIAHKLRMADWRTQISIRLQPKN